VSSEREAERDRESSTVNSPRRGGGIDPIWYAPVLFLVVTALTALTAVLFTGAARTFIPLTLVSDRAGLVMENGAKVKLRGVQVGEVDSIGQGSNRASLRLKMYPGPFQYLPSDVQAEIKSSTAFGAKFVDLIVPSGGSAKPLVPGAVLHSRNVTVEVNTVFQNLQSVVQSIDPAKLNSVLSAVAEAVRGKGDVIGQAITDSNQVLLAVNPRMPTVKQDWQLFGQTAQAYSNAAQDIVSILDSFSTTSTTIANQSAALNDVLLSSVGFAKSGVTVLGGNQPDLVKAMNLVAPTTELLNKYSPTYTCLFQGAQWFLEHGGRDALGGNGRSVIMDAALLAGDDPYRFPDNLPVVNAKGGPGGRPSCGSLPDVSKNFPVKYLVTDTGFGTGLDVRPNPGIGFPGFSNYFPATKAIPEPPKNRYSGGPAPGPLPLYPGAPPYGAPEFAPDGTALYPPAPGAPPPPPGPLPAPDPAPAPSEGQP
jgi:phospholipid/cholesterol/gamma-HCH transport system substrate-binding protein